MTRFLFSMINVFLILICSAIASQATDVQTQPNVIYVLADDLGYTDLACFGSKYYETPNLDQMAREGRRMTSAYTCGPNCQPTRAALMSGQYGPRTGVYTVGDIERFDWRSRPLRPVDNVTQMPLDRVLLPQAFHSGGYATAIFGKWHLGDDGPYHPTRRGFDEGFVTAGKHFDFETTPEQKVPKGVYLADYLTDRAIDFIERHQSKPFFLYLTHFGVHSPWQAKPELVDRYQSKPGVDGHNNPTYAAMIHSVDQSVGRIRESLKRLNLSERTLIIFTSDNGGVGGYVREGIKPGKEATDNAPLRGGKGMLYEGGIRVPYIAAWPNVIPAGSSSDEPINSVDLYPTMLEVANLVAGEKNVLDGTSYLNHLKGKESSTKRPPLFWHFPGYLGANDNTWRTTPAGAIRDGEWKLIEFFEDGHRELYHLKTDLGERKNLAMLVPERTKLMAKLLQSWRDAINAPMPTENPNRLAPGAGKKRGTASD